MVQFGGPKEKKFKSKPLNKLFFEISNKSMKEQKELLKTAYENWRGNVEQVDDVVVLGVRI